MNWAMRRLMLQATRVLCNPATRRLKAMTPHHGGCTGDRGTVLTRTLLALATALHEQMLLPPLRRQSTATLPRHAAWCALLYGYGSWRPQLLQVGVASCEQRESQ